MKVSTLVLSLFLVSISSSLPIGSQNGIGRRDLQHPGSHFSGAASAGAHTLRLSQELERRQNLKDAAVNFLKPLGVPDAMLELIKVGPDSIIQKIISQPGDKLQTTIDSLKQGKIPAVDGIKPKDLMVQFLPGLKVPEFMIELVKGAPDEIIDKIATLPIDKLQPIIDQMKLGKIPAVPDVAPRDLIVQFLPGIGVPSATIELIKNLPDSAIEQIVALPGDQLEKTIGELKQGKIPNIPGLTGPVPSEPSAAPEKPAPTPTKPMKEAPAAPTITMEAPAKDTPAPKPTKVAPPAEKEPAPPMDAPEEAPKPTETPKATKPIDDPANKMPVAPAGPVITIPASALGPLTPGSPAYLIAIPVMIAAAPSDGA